MGALATNLARVNGTNVEVLRAEVFKPISMSFRHFGNVLSGYVISSLVYAALILANHALFGLKARGKGAIINVSSVAAQTGMGTYSANKAWVLAFTEGLAEQLRGSGVHATAVIPGLTNTEFHERAGVDVSGANALAWTKPTQVVDAALDAAKRGQVIVTPTVRYKVVYQLSRVLPRSLVRSVTRRLPHM